jgi:hypothetical protein
MSFLGSESLFLFLFNPLFSLSEVCGHMFSLDLKLQLKLFSLFLEGSSLFLLNYFKRTSLIFILLVKRSRWIFDMFFERSCLFLILSFQLSYLILILFCLIKECLHKILSQTLKFFGKHTCLIFWGSINSFVLESIENFFALFVEIFELTLSSLSDYGAIDIVD